MADGVQIEGMVFEAATAVQGGASPSASDRAVAPSLQEDDLALDRSLRPKKLCDYLGQTKVKESLAILIEAAQQRKECADHILFSGPPGAWQDHACHGGRQRARCKHPHDERAGY